MRFDRQRIWLTVILIGAAVGLYYGWRLFWFMTDDALIAFRYVSNSVLGIGYTWNPPPFRPVEGYTSFLWVVLLDIVWRWFGAEPPQIANWLSLAFSALTLGLTVWTVMRLKLSERLARFRLAFVGLVLLGALTNRTFLAWTSSGLETALFNFCLTLWIVLAVMTRRRGTWWLAGLTLAASLVYLSRPDGLLILASTALIAILWLRLRARRGSFRWRHVSCLLPLVIPLIHLLWRRAYYGEWLPNTYYAKHVAAWPEAGLRYLASFALEYGLWFWLAIMIWFGWRWLRSRSRAEASQPGSATLSRRVIMSIVVLTVIGHVAYYTLIIGGDHFEYRVFSYLVPLFFISLVGTLNRLTRDGVIACGLIGLFIVVSWPIAWTQWAITRGMTSRDDTWALWMPVAPEFPPGFRWYAESFDDLQSWLIERHVCMRHQEHKVFYQYLSSLYPSRSEEVPGSAGVYPIAACQSTGVPGWVFPKVAVLDAFGLNDYVIARHKPYPRRFRLMAHDRYPPAGYFESFSFNYGRMANRSSGFIRRDYEISAEEIAATEQFWVDRIVHDREAPFSYAMLNRIGESFIRTAEPDSAVIFLERAIALDSLPARAYVNLAGYYTKIGALDSALGLLRTAYRREPAESLVLTQSGRAYAAVGYDLVEADPEAAEAVLDTAVTRLSDALQADSTRMEALIELAAITLFRDQVDSSEVFLTRLERGRPPAADLHLLGERYRFKQRLDLAFRAYRLAIKNDLNRLIMEDLVRAFPELTE